VPRQPRTSAPVQGGDPMFGTLLASRPKRNYRSAVSSTIGSVVVHAIIITGLVVATMRAADAPAGTEQIITLTDLAPEPEPIPPPPMLEAEPPSVAAAAAPRGFPTLPTPDVVPTVIPPQSLGIPLRAEDYNPIGVAGGSPTGKVNGKSVDDIGTQPFLVPMEVEPRVLNRSEVINVVSRNYPQVLRDAGISGKTNVWIRLNEEGKPVTWQVKTPSGFAAFDSAAVRVVPSLKFSPAISQDRKIPVWIQMDIVFQVKH
jgi:TonB family protein